MPCTPLFITARFRSGSTLLWNIFRNTEGCTAFYEPCHDMLLKRCLYDAEASPDHIGVHSYWDEYQPLLQPLSELHHPDFATRHLLLENNDSYDELRRYISFLSTSIAAFPVLQFNRIDFRLPWIRNNFPDARILHLFRDPREQWMSTIGTLPSENWDNPLENTPFDLVVWSCSLANHFPFLFSDQIKTAYHRHYVLWKLSKLMGERCSNLSIAFEDLLGSPEASIRTLMDFAGVENADCKRLALHVSPPITGTWRQVRNEDWFAYAEAECDDILNRLGLLEDFGHTPMSVIKKRYAPEWQTVEKEGASKALDAMQSLYIAQRHESYEKMHLATLAYNKVTDVMNKYAQQLESCQNSCEQHASTGSQPSHAPEHTHEQLDLLAFNRFPQVVLKGLGLVEQADAKHWRWGLGPSSSITFYLTEAQHICLRLRFFNPFDEQSFTILHNETVVLSLPSLAEGAIEEVNIILHATKINSIQFSYGKWNQEVRKFPLDERTVAVMFEELTLTAEHGPLRFPTDMIDSPHVKAPLQNDTAAREHYRDGHAVLSSLPPVVTLALTTRCTNRIPCVICDRNTRDETSDCDITEEVFKAATPLIQTARYLLLHCGGEPMLSPFFDKTIDLVAPPTRVTFATNGMLLVQARADRMLARDIMGAFTVSMDASTPKTYKFMRPSCDFDKVTKNVAYYTNTAHKLGRDAAMIFLNMTICKSNLEDVPQLVDLASQLGASLVEFNHLNPGLVHSVERIDGISWNYLEEASFFDKERHDDLVLLAWERAQSAGLRVVFNGKPFIGSHAEEYEQIAQSMRVNPFCDDGDVVWTSPYHVPLNAQLPPCLKPWQETVIQPNGVVRLCYYHDEAQYSVGNILDHEFFRIWNSAEMVEERLHFFGKGVAARCHASNPCLRCRPHE